MAELIGLRETLNWIVNGRSTSEVSDSAWPGPTRNAILIYMVAIFLISQALFLWGIDQPTQPYFDEVHYIPAALAYIHQLPLANPEHPPLAKWLMAVSISSFGNNPLGWRYASALFGSLSLVGMYLWGLSLFKDNRAALWATAATFLNQVVYVQARIAMLDIFYLAFMIWGMAAFSATWISLPHLRVKSLFMMTGVFLGLSAACKWVGFVPLVLIVAIVATVKIFQHWRVSFAGSVKDDWFNPKLWVEMSGWDWVLSLALLPTLAYYLSFICAGPENLLPTNFIAAQILMWQDNSTLSGSHPYMSGWTDWPLLHRTVWYFFQGSSWDTVAASAQAVVYLGNPLLLWTGLIAIGVCAYGWLSNRRREAFVITASYVALWLCWAVIPRHLTFSFYYLPASAVLSLALAYMFYFTRLNQWPWVRRLFLFGCLVVFAYFLPISNAAVHISEPGYNGVMWFKSWR